MTTLRSFRTIPNSRRFYLVPLKHKSERQRTGGGWPDQPIWTSDIMGGGWPTHNLISRTSDTMGGVRRMYEPTPTSTPRAASANPRRSRVL